MKNNLEIIMTASGQYALIDGFSTIREDSKVINKSGNGLIRTVVKVCGTLGYIGHGGASFLYIREEQHRRFVKYITKRDLNKIAPKRSYRIKWNNKNTI